MSNRLITEGLNALAEAKIAVAGAGGASWGAPVTAGAGGASLAGAGAAGSGGNFIGHAINAAGVVVSSIFGSKDKNVIDNLVGTPGLSELSSEQAVLIRAGIDPWFTGDQTPSANPRLTDKFYYYKDLFDLLGKRPSRQPISKAALLASGLMSRSRQPISAEELQKAGITDQMIQQAMQAAKQEVAQDAKGRTRTKRTSKELTVYLTISLAAILAAGFTIDQARRTIRRVRNNIQTRKTSMDIVKLASMGNTKGAEAILKKEFNKTGVNLDKISSALQGASESDMKLAAKILRQELDL
jgi:SOS response regulatory protein OraA/RecX